MVDALGHYRSARSLPWPALRGGRGPTQALRIGPLPTWLRDQLRCIPGICSLSIGKRLHSRLKN